MYTKPCYFTSKSAITSDIATLSWTYHALSLLLLTLQFGRPSLPTHLQLPDYLLSINSIPVDSLRLWPHSLQSMAFPHLLIPSCLAFHFLIIMHFPICFSECYLIFKHLLQLCWAHNKHSGIISYHYVWNCPCYHYYQPATTWVSWELGLYLTSFHFPSV